MPVLGQSIDKWFANEIICKWNHSWACACLCSQFSVWKDALLDYKHDKYSKVFL